MSDLAVSQVEKLFMTNQIYKRSKRYFDVIRLKSIQNSSQKQRRKPKQLQKQYVQHKIASSFMSSQDFYKKRRQNQIQVSKKRNLSHFNNDQKDEVQTNYSVATKYNSTMSKKCFDMTKTLPRQFYENLTHHQNAITDGSFDNHIIGFSDPHKKSSIDFNKFIGRKNTTKNDNYKNQQNLNETVNPQQSYISQKYNVNIKQRQKCSKEYQKIVFDQSSFRCLFSIQKQRKKLQKSSIKVGQKLPQVKQVNLQRVDKGLKLTTKSKQSVNLMFFYGYGKEEPAQIHYKTLKNNQNYWKEQINQIKKQDFQTLKRKETMIEKKLEQIHGRTRVIDTRGEICDAKYFLRQQQRQKRL